MSALVLLLDDPEPVKSRLVVHAGEFCATELGISTNFRPPLSRLSGEYPWMAVPIGVAAMKLLVTGCGSGDSVAALLSRFQIGSEDLDLFDDALGRVWEGSGPTSASLEMIADNPWVSSMNQLVHWCGDLSCPYPSTSHDLVRLGRMTDDELEGYVMSFMG